MRTIIMLGVLLGLATAGGRAAQAADAPAAPNVPGRWTEQQAADWQKQTGWLAGANYTPATAINQLEMWQADSFDPATIDRELAMAESLGFNSMRVFLHHLVWEQDAEGLYKRMDQFLGIAEKHKVRIMFVLFDSCWDPEPKLGKQREPKKGVHNSGWVQSPGKADLMDAKRHPVLEAYVKGVVGRFKYDARVVVWDVWNEPDNQNDNSYGKNHLKTEPAGKLQATIPLLAKAFEWARAAKPSQPLTSGPWIGPKKPQDALSTTEQVQVHHSDVITFHTYNDPAGVEKWIAYYKKFNRPMLCTEYMARPNGSRFDPTLQVFKNAGVGAYCWGFVAGKTNTIHAWKTWQEPEPKDEPTVWFHDIFRPDGSAFDAKEVEYIKRVTGKAGK